jgi:hypothetical protein
MYGNNTYGVGRGLFKYYSGVCVEGPRKTTRLSARIAEIRTAYLRNTNLDGYRHVSPLSELHSPLTGTHATDSRQRRYINKTVKLSL